MNSIQTSLSGSSDASNKAGQALQVIANDTSLDYPKVRPQRLHTWFHLIPVEEFEKKRPQQILFLDTFATVVRNDADTGNPYTVLFEGVAQMTHVLYLGLIFVWYGEDLASPDRPFPTLYEETFPTEYQTRDSVVFENTHIMDFVENGSDNLHFKHVHLWDYSKIYNHTVTDGTITLDQDTRIHYGRCSFNPFIRFMSYILPELELHHDYVYHGPGIAVVGAEGKGAPESHSIVTLTPEGPDRTRVYVTIGMPATTFPQWAEKTYQTIFRRRRLCESFAGVMAGYIKNEFDVDAVIWNGRKVMHQYGLLRSEQHLQNVIDWGKTFYPSDFEMPPEPQEKPEDEKEWVLLDQSRNIKQGKINTYKVGKESLIAYRDSKRAVHVRDAYCPHQGAHLGVKGRIEDDCVRCPFHGFYYDEVGNCRGSNINNTNKPIEGLKLKIISHREAAGGVEVLV
ncbi:MAG: nitrite reductase/ring-hydroxylating ferredoxin subunit [Halioglobus sp.]|jgi:nitrite reductase/ring-hydroxylating ferredoxin subunit